MACRLRIMQPIGTGLDELSAREFIDALDKCGEVDEIVVDINSEGGEVFDGFAIAEALRDNPARIVTRALGGAFSIASVIFAAGDERLMAENAMLMIHDPSGGAIGTAEEIRRQADSLDKLTDSILNVYLRHSSIGREEIRQMMKEERMIDAEEAVALGLATGIIEPTPTRIENIRIFRDNPERFVAAFRVDSGLNSKEHKMSLQETIKKIKAKCEGADDSFILKHVAAGSDMTDIVADWSKVLNAKASELESQIAEMKEEMAAKIAEMEEEMEEEAQEEEIEEEIEEEAEGDMEEEITKANSRARRIAVASRQSRNRSGSATEEWQKAISDAMKENSRLTRNEAAKVVNRRNLGLRERMLQESAVNRERRIVPKVMNNGVMVVR